MANTITISSHGKSMAAMFYTPASTTTTTTHGAIIIGYGSDGMNTPWGKMIEEYAESLAAKGFSVLIPNYLTVTNTQAGPAVFPLIMEHRDDWEGALSDAIGHAKNLPQVDPARIGLLGFSLGGYLCIRLRAKVKVLVEFFAPAFDGMGAPGTLRHAQVHHGKADNLIPFADAETIAQKLKGEGASTELYPYPESGHGFVGDDPGNTKARDLSRERTQAFFESHL